MAGVAFVRVLKGQQHRVGARRDSDQVHVVGHQAIAQQLEAAQPAMLAQQVEVDQAVGIAFENHLAGIAALGNVVRRINCHHPCESGHDT